MFVDLRSDTVTKPSVGMLDAMFNAEVGDDVFSEDPTTKKLEDYTASLFGMQAGLFCPSGTMTNQIAIKAQTQPLDEIICDKLSHIYNYETGGWAFHSGVSVRLTDSERGVMNVEQVKNCILPDFDWYPNSKMVCVENTVNKGGGAVYTLTQLKELSKFCSDSNLIFHLDGARIFNALEATGNSPSDFSGLFNSISVCLSKGLGTPAGSVLLGSAEMIKKARKIRKVMGGGMRQSGYIAAAGVYALKNNVVRLSDDHIRAQTLGKTLAQCNWVKALLPVETNIVIVEVNDSAFYTQKLADLGVKCSPFSPTHIRFVTHLDFSDDMLEYTLGKFKVIN
jgi:threonine aldolase